MIVKKIVTDNVLDRDIMIGFQYRATYTGIF